jgi:hypothetical protein
MHCSVIDLVATVWCCSLQNNRINSALQFSPDQFVWYVWWTEVGLPFSFQKMLNFSSLELTSQCLCILEPFLVDCIFLVKYMSFTDTQHCCVANVVLPLVFNSIPMLNIKPFTSCTQNNSWTVSLYYGYI